MKLPRPLGAGVRVGQLCLSEVRTAGGADPSVPLKDPGCVVVAVTLVDAVSQNKASPSLPLAIYPKSPLRLTQCQTADTNIKQA